MNIEDVARCIEDPSLCKAEYIADLESLIAKYPYSQSFPLLLLKTLGAEKSLNFDDALNAHAFRVSDRVRLYELIQAKEQDSGVPTEIIQKVPTEQAEENVTEERIEADFVSDTAENLEEEVAHEKIDDSASEELETRTSELDSIQQEIINDFSETEISSEEAIDELVEESVSAAVSLNEESLDHLPHTNETQTEDDLSEPDEEEMELKIELVDEDLTIEDEEENAADFEVEIPVKEVENFDLTKLEETIENSKVESENTIEEVDPSAFEEEEKSVTLDLSLGEDVDKDRTTSEALSQSYHLTMSLDKKERKEAEIEAEEEPKQKKEKKEKSKKKKKEKAKKEGKKDKKKGKEEKAEKKSDKKKKKKFSSWLKPENALIEDRVPAEDVSQTKKSEDNKKPVETANTPINKEAIIDEFIEKDPKIRRFEESIKEEVKEKVPFFNPLEKAKESINEEVMPVSETLAKIYVAQGNYPKAIVAYNQLMLLFPEKKIFFADQIRKLEQNTN